MAEFYIEKIAQSTGEHLLHNASCQQLPSKETIQYVGSIASAKSAIASAGKYFRHIAGCPHCIPA